MRPLKSNLFTFAFFVFGNLILFSCKKDHPALPLEEPTTGSLTISLDHKWGDESTPFAMDTNLVHPENGDTLKFSRLNYYISNVRLKRADGSWWSQPESYFIVKVGDGILTDLVIPDVPAAEYTEIEYMIGVDSTRNVSGAQTGALSTIHNMSWGWDTGYIFLKAEGNSPQANMNFFSYHVGGFRKSNNTYAIRWVTFNLDDNPLQLAAGTSRRLSVFVNVAKIWSNGIRVSDVNAIHSPGALANSFATHFQGAFSFDQIH